MNRRVGAYGLTLTDAPDTSFLTAAGDDWPMWSLRYADEPCSAPIAEFVNAEHALIRTQPAGSASISKHQATTVLTAERGAGHAFVHPHLTSTAVVAAEWSGRLAFHGGAFVDSQMRAWGVLGDRGAGKSSAMAWCATHEIPVIADDLVVTDGMSVFSGPRCVDLRKSAAHHFGIGVDIGFVGSRRRWRHRTEQVQAEYPLAGWIILRWDASIGLTPLPVAETARRLAANRALLLGQQHPVPWLHAIAAPTFTFGRPKDWAAVDDAMIELIRGVTPAPSR